MCIVYDIFNFEKLGCDLCFKVAHSHSSTGSVAHTGSDLAGSAPAGKSHWPSRCDPAGEDTQPGPLWKISSLTGPNHWPPSCACCTTII